MQRRRYAAALGLALLLAACTPHVQIRTVSVDGAGKPIHCGHSDPKGCDEGRNAIEHRRYVDKKGHDGTYHLGFVEFDDQGWFWDRKQMEGLLNYLYEKKNEEYLIIVFAHGWRHNAKKCDTNVTCFQRLLERFDVMERTAKKPRQVVGVYIGWRGLSADVQPFEILSFWERKNTAERVGLGGVSELLNRLNELRQFRNPKRESDKTQLIVSGHSFGGQVIYSALAHALIERATQQKPGHDGGIAFDTATSFGDLVVLVNPAFEGSLYETLHHAATNRCYGAEQRPVMLIVTSDADAATGQVFPIGRHVGNLFESTQSKNRDDQVDAILNTVGHLDRYRTHRLALADKVPAEVFDKNDEECDCPFLEPTTKFDLQKETDLIEEVGKARDQMKTTGMKYVTSAELGKKSILYGDDIVLERVPDYVPNYPYFVISTDGTLIPGHNEIYGERFTDFLRRFYLRHIVAHINFPRECRRNLPACDKASAISPCEQSCQRDANGASCSGRRADVGASGGMR